MIDHYYLAIVEARLQLSHSGATLKQYFPVNNPRINRKQGLDLALLFKVVLRPKKNFVFPLDFKTMLTKH